MRPFKARYQLWQIMLAIAVLAGLFAAFGVTGAMAVLIVAGAIILPIRPARPDHRMRATAWVASLYPLLLPLSLYATWFTAWVVLGHRPRSSLDDPKSISPFVEVPYIAFFLLLISLPFSLLASLLLMLAHVIREVRRRSILPLKATALMFAPVLIWLAVFAILSWKPFGIDYIIEWYFD